MAKDVDQFAAAMSGVKPLKGHKPTGRAKTVIPRPKAESPSDSTTGASWVLSGLLSAEGSSTEAGSTSLLDCASALSRVLLHDAD